MESNYLGLYSHKTYLTELQSFEQDHYTDNSSLKHYQTLQKQSRYQCKTILLPLIANSVIFDSVH